MDQVNLADELKKQVLFHTYFLEQSSILMDILIKELIKVIFYVNLFQLIVHTRVHIYI